MLVRSCLNSGWCCRKSPCGFGEWSQELSRCIYLVPSVDAPDRFLCGKYEEISAIPSAKFNPAFGYGCCSPMNSDREAIKEKYFGGVEQVIEIEDFY
ncbi:hypothetical protein ACQKQC_05685 [Vibrio fortis]|uniref:hypothetical protein n=1 Tax=Vibrio fortis TaxID=212667 RepID=UPI0040697246